MSNHRALARTVKFHVGEQWQSDALGGMPVGLIDVSTETHRTRSIRFGAEADRVSRALLEIVEFPHELRMPVDAVDGPEIENQQLVDLDTRVASRPQIGLGQADLPSHLLRKARFAFPSVIPVASRRSAARRRCRRTWFS